jgi:glycosyltransferase involved in cell wall biosynthesis
MQYVLVNNDNVIEAVSDRPGGNLGLKSIPVDVDFKASEILGRKLVVDERQKIKLAIICNWNMPCGISTYSKFLVDSIRPKVLDVKIFSETVGDTSMDASDNCVRIWSRGQEMSSTVRAIKEWGADFVLIQHEFGIFPVATHFLKMLEELQDIPYAVVLHSVYESHFDKTICTSAIKEIICHSEQAKRILVGQGHDAAHIAVVPHGCVSINNSEPLWNCFQTPYAIVQFGFGFRYKGVDRAIEAVAHLKKTDPKFKDIFYCYLCSQAPHARHYHSEYYRYLKSKVETLGVSDNVAIIQKFHSEQIINNYLRTAKMALFPYLVDPDNTVYGASGAIRIAMANGIPVVASESHLFDDMEGILPRPKDHLELAREIDEIFSNDGYRNGIVSRSREYVTGNSWDITAERYLGVVDNILAGDEFLRML